MTNDLPSLNERLATALRDPDYAVWSAPELDDLLTWSVARLSPHAVRQLDPDLTANKITLVTNTYYYALPTGFEQVYRVDWVDADNEERGPVFGGTWEVVAGFLHVSPTIVEQLGTLRLNGYGRYGVTTNLIPDELVPLVLAMARAEAYRRLGADRTQFEQWLSRNQSSNVTVNELLQHIREASVESEGLWRRARTMQKPVPGRVR